MGKPTLLKVLVEGQTEAAFVRQLLAPHLRLRGIESSTVLSGKGGGGGGVRNWDATLRDLSHLLNSGHHCSTMFDFYALPLTWPGRADAAQKLGRERASFVEAALVAAVSAKIGAKFDVRRFHPYVQLHEFEALLFADTRALATSLVSIADRSKSVSDDSVLASLVQKFDDILHECGEPEAINDSYETCPSRRIAGVVRAYKKVAFGATVTERIGLPLLRERCPHFGEWLARLEEIGA
jgi:hypothetical protein